MKKAEPLRVVLSLRTRHQDSAERALAEALTHQQQAQQLLLSLQDQLLRARTARHAAAGELLNVVEMQHRAMRIPQLKQCCTEAEAALAERKRHVAEQQQSYLDARRAREIVEALLKQRRLVEQQTQSRHDTKVSEDLFLGRMLRRSTDDS